MKRSFCRKSLVFLLVCLLLSLLGSAAAAEDLSLTFSLESGFYHDETTLYITCNTEEADIYYTIDGSLPDEEDLYYDEGIFLEFTTDKEDELSHLAGTESGEDFMPLQDFPSAHVIRAVAMLEDGSVGPVVSGTYFIGYDREKLYGDVTLVSLLVEPDDFFDWNTGIYVLGAIHDEWAAQQAGSYENWEAVGNFTQHGREWERTAEVQFLPAQGEGFSQTMGVRIKGGASRGYKHKSLRLIAREEYGAKKVKYAVFPDNLRETDGEVLERYKSFTLRNGGNDVNFSKIRDPYITAVAEGLRLETAATQPAIAFINGEYWGMYTLTEEFTDNFIDYHYGINNENVVLFKNGEVQDGEEADAELYWSMYRYIVDNDMSDPACYAEACKMLDMDSFVDYLALTLYISNEDDIFKNNNWEMWRVRAPGQDDSPYADGLWRMMLFDTDYSSGVYSEGGNFGENNLKPLLFEQEAESDSAAALVHSLLKNADFQQKLVVAMGDIRNLYFELTRAGGILEKMKAEYLPYGGDTFRRFGPEWIARWSNADAHFASKIDTIHTFFKGRYGSFPNLVSKTFDLAFPVNVFLRSSSGEAGAVYLNGRDIPITEQLATRQFVEYPVTLTAQPMEGHRFLRWEVSSEDILIEDPTAPAITVTFTEVCTLTAVFE